MCPTVLFVIVVPLQDEWTPLHAAAYKGHTEVVHALIAAGASINKANNVGDRAGY